MIWKACWPPSQGAPYLSSLNRVLGTGPGTQQTLSKSWLSLMMIHYSQPSVRKN